MKRICLVTTAIFAGTLLALAQNRAPATNATPEDVEAKYTRDLEGRAAGVLQELALKDSAKATNVHDTVIAQYRALRAWHDANDAKLKAALKSDTNAVPGIQASLKAVHDQFLARLAKDLDAAQVEKVKDKMTYGKVKVTYDAYVEIVPHLTDVEKAHMLALLKEARETAMDCGSSQEKDAVFNKYKGKINNYLSAQGHNVSQAYKDWGAKQKEKAAGKSPIQD